MTVLVGELLCPRCGRGLVSQAIHPHPVWSATEWFADRLCDGCEFAIERAAFLDLWKAAAKARVKADEARRALVERACPKEYANEEGEARACLLWAGHPGDCGPWTEGVVSI